MRRTLSFAAFLLIAGASALAAPPLKITDAWVLEPNPARAIGAGFMTIENTGDEAVTITGASSKAAEVVEIHEMKMEDGMMKMRMLKSLEVPAHGKVTLEPGGLHLMLIRLTGKLVEGDTVTIELALAGGDTIEVTAPVRKREMDH